MTSTLDSPSTQRTRSRGVASIMPNEVLAARLGFLLFAPAVGVPLGGTSVQPLDLVAVPTFVLLFPRLARVNGAAFGLVMLCMLSWVMSVLLAPASPGWVEVGFYLIGVAPLLVATLALLHTERGRLSFLRGFLLGGALSAVTATIQGFAGGSSVIDLRTNQTFNLLAQPGRSMAFFPEASAFAAAAAIHLAVLTHLRMRGHDDPSLRRWIKFAPALMLFDVLGIAFARSTSTLVLIPILYVLSLRSLGLRSSTMLRRMLLAAPLLFILGVLFISQFYADRFATNDAFNSVETRLSTILASVEPLRNGQLTGVGVGNNDLASEYIIDVSNRYGLRAAVTTGIASLTGQRLFEEGLGAVLSVGAATWVYFRNLEHRTSPVSQSIVLMAGGFMVSSFVVSGYRGLYTSWIWIALAGVLRARSKPRPTQSVQKPT